MSGRRARSRQLDWQITTLLVGMLDSSCSDGIGRSRNYFSSVRFLMDKAPILELSLMNHRRKKQDKRSFRTGETSCVLACTATGERHQEKSFLNHAGNPSKSSRLGRTVV